VVSDKRASLTTPGVSKVFSLLSANLEQTSPSAHGVRLFLSPLFPCITLTCSARLRSSTQCCPPNIFSITIDHDELFELPIPTGRRPNQSAGDFSHHSAFLASPHRHHCFSAASVDDDRTRCTQSGPATWSTSDPQLASHRHARLPTRPPKSFRTHTYENDGEGW